MSLFRATGLLIQALFNQLAATPPTLPPSSPSAEKSAEEKEELRKYHTEQWWFFRIAPAMLQLHTILAWLLSIVELLFALSSLPSFTFEGVTPLFCMGVVLSVVGGIMRLVCFKALGEMFTFTLTIHPKHRLITHSIYAYVRHPAYTGSQLMVLGLGITHLLVPEALLVKTVGWEVCYVMCGMWWIWLGGVGVSRARAEDKEMYRLFGAEWEEYAKRVRWWYVPGLI